MTTTTDVDTLDCPWRRIVLICPLGSTRRRVSGSALALILAGAVAVCQAVYGTTERYFGPVYRIGGPIRCRPHERAVV